MKLWKSTYYSLISIMVIYLVKPLKGDYVLRVRVHSYSNPDNYCAQCNGGMGCCDDPSRTTCSGSLRCDNKFFFCVRPLSAAFPQTTILSSISEPTVSGRAGLLGCLQPSTALRSGINTNGGTIDFSGTSFLGLSNPLEFEITATMWEGIQFYMDVFDDDPGGGSPPDLVDAYRIDAPPINLPAGLPFTPPISYDGRFSLSSTVLSFQLECQPGFVGANCIAICAIAPCRNNGTCLSNGGNFMCMCMGDYTGGLCDQIITTTITTDTNTSTITDNTNTTDDAITSSDTSNSKTPTVLAGVVAGAVVVTILVTLLAVFITVSFLRQRAAKSETEGVNSSDIPTKENPSDDIRECSECQPNEDDYSIPTRSNPVYGIKESRFTGADIPTDSNPGYGVFPRGSNIDDIPTDSNPGYGVFLGQNHM